MASIIVRPLDIMSEATWQYRDQFPRWQHRRHGSSAMFDPFPAYPHDLADVEATVRHVEACVPPLWDVELFVADREEEGRSNGYSNVLQAGHYEGDEWVKDDPVGLIVLSGKRVPPHPAMTRYLVAHEYGHNIEWMLNEIRGAKHTQSDDLVTEYAKVRGLPDGAVHYGSGGRWHDSAAEIFACDFRTMVCKVETDFWPHRGVPLPGEVPALWDWWSKAVDQLRTAGSL